MAQEGKNQNFQKTESDKNPQHFLFVFRSFIFYYHRAWHQTSIVYYTLLLRNILNHVANELMDVTPQFP